MTSIYETYARHTRDLTLACSKGCTSCCSTCNVTVTALEADGILVGLSRAMSGQ